MALIDVVDHVSGSLFLSVAFVALILTLLSWMRFAYAVHAWYAGAAACVSLASWSEGVGLAYFFAFALGVVTAFAEIIGKFKDEPLKALKTYYAFVYHLLNGFIAMFALWLITVDQAPEPGLLEQVKNVIAAGIGSMLLLRSKLFNIKVDGQDVSFGPDQIIRIYFSYMETAIDRIRSEARIEFVRKQMHNLDFDALYDYTVTMLYARQMLDDEQREELRKQIDAIKQDGPGDKQLKSYRLGFALLNACGEDLVRRLFDSPAAHWRLKAPDIDLTDDGGLLSKLRFRPETEVYFAYGPSMSSQRICEKLDMQQAKPEAFAAATRMRKGVLAMYSLVFNGVSEAAPGFGSANLQSNEDDSVEGVIYELPQGSLAFLDRKESGYRRTTVTVSESNGKTIQAVAYVAHNVKPQLKPDETAVRRLIEGARENGLSPEYIARVQQSAADAAASAAFQDMLEALYVQDGYRKVIETGKAIVEAYGKPGKVMFWIHLACAQAARYKAQLSAPQSGEDPLASLERMYEALDEAMRIDKSTARHHMKYLSTPNLPGKPAEENDFEIVRNEPRFQSYFEEPGAHTSDQAAVPPSTSDRQPFRLEAIERTGNDEGATIRGGEEAAA